MDEREAGKNLSRYEFTKEDLILLAEAARVDVEEATWEEEAGGEEYLRIMKIHGDDFFDTWWHYGPWHPHRHIQQAFMVVNRFKFLHEIFELTCIGSDCIWICSMGDIQGRADFRLCITHDQAAIPDAICKAAIQVIKRDKLEDGIIQFVTDNPGTDSEEIANHFNLDHVKALDVVNKLRKRGNIESMPDQPGLQRKIYPHHQT